MQSYDEQLRLWQRWLASRGEVAVGAVLHRHTPQRRPSGHVVGTPWNFKYGERFERTS